MYFHWNHLYQLYQNNIGTSTYLSHLDMLQRSLDALYFLDGELCVFAEASKDCSLVLSAFLTSWLSNTNYAVCLGCIQLIIARKGSLQIVWIDTWRQVYQVIIGAKNWVVRKYCPGINCGQNITAEKINHLAENPVRTEYFLFDVLPARTWVNLLPNCSVWDSKHQTVVILHST